jgi:hypothetical protein
MRGQWQERGLVKGTVAQCSAAFADHISRSEAGFMLKLPRLCIIWIERSLAPGAKRTSGKNIDVGEVPEAVANASVLVELSNMTLGI